MSDIQDLIEYYRRDTPKNTHHALYNARTNRRDIEQFGLEPLANAEHYQFGRSLVGENPLWFPSVIAATPLYYAAKKAGILPSDEYTSEGSLEQMGAGILGAWHGLTR